MHRPPLFFLLLLLTACGREKTANPTATASPTPAAVSPVAETPVAAAAEPASCVSCHAKEVEKWRLSQHSLAQRAVSPADHPAFAGQKLPLPAPENGAVFSLASPAANGSLAPAVATTGADGKNASFQAVSAIGVWPLVQYLTDAPDGRRQVFRPAWDVDRKEWFDPFDGEPRSPHDWGYWSSRGMNWNSNCAFCHTTEFRKNYDPAADRYDSKFVNEGITCRSCHGPREVDAKTCRPLAGESVRKVSKEPATAMETCAGCHSRREELTGRFVPGDAYADHFRPVFPDAPGLFHPDGRSLGENFVHSSFRLSKMAQAGVTCRDCHDPHSGQPLAPVETNQLCLTCHGPGQRGAPVIVPQAHSFHDPAKPGGRCVDCHMPETTYMGRDPRRDHTFSIPDALLTQKTGAPNACNSCHKDKDTAWAVAASERFWGDKMKRPTRDRALLFHAAQSGTQSDAKALLASLAKETAAPWKAAHLGLLTPHAADPAVQAAAQAALNDPEPFVRGAAIRLAWESNNPAVLPAIQEKLRDPRRLPRIEAAVRLAAAGPLPPESEAELLRWLEFTSDQPAGALRLAEYRLDRQLPDEAAKLAERAAEWDKSSATTQTAAGVILSRSGRPGPAAQALKRARELDPKDAHLAYLHALSLIETGSREPALEALRESVKLNPAHPRAGYNLGLLLAEMGRLGDAVATLKAAAGQIPGDPAIPYALATLQLRLGDREGARAAVSQALQADPAYPEALQLKAQLEGARRPDAP